MIQKVAMIEKHHAQEKKQQHYVNRSKMTREWQNIRRQTSYPNKISQAAFCGHA